MSRLLITGSRAHQWTSYDSHALLIAVREILEKTHELPLSSMAAHRCSQKTSTPGALALWPHFCSFCTETNSSSVPVNFHKVTPIV